MRGIFASWKAVIDSDHDQAIKDTQARAIELPILDTTAASQVAVSAFLKQLLLK